MPTFSPASAARLVTAHPDLQRMCREAILYYDFTIQEAHRTPARQAKLYAQGRTTPGPIVTQTLTSLHTQTPALAVDITPWPGGYDSPVNEFYRMAGVILSTAARLGIKVQWGGDWVKFKDYPHFQLSTTHG